jgi:cell division cycle 2-like
MTQSTTVLMGPTAAKRRDRWASSDSEDEESGRKLATSGKRGKIEANSALTEPSSHGNLHQHQQSNEVSAPNLPLHNPLLSGCRSVYETYERIERISEGSYGVVWKARDLATGHYMALKQIKFHGSSDSSTSGITMSSANSIWKEGFPVTALREINVLLALQHESIVSVREMVVGDAPDQVFMVMEFFECDLKEALRHSSTGGPLAQAELKGILQQILAGVNHMHEARYMHRDLKPSNILVKMSSASNGTGGGRIALADFGLARRYQDPPTRSLTLPVVTLWYRAPELLFGESRYGPAVDMWSIGCIMGELIHSGGGGGTGNDMTGDDLDNDSNAILKGQGEVDQIDQIFSLVGVPDKSTWPTFDQLPNAGLLRWKPIAEANIRLPELFPVASVGLSSQQTFLDANGYQLLKGLLTLDPARRLTAEQAVQHNYLSLGVAPQIPRFFASSSR